MSYDKASGSILDHLRAYPEFERVRSLPGYECDDALLGQIIEAAAAIAEDVLEPLNIKNETAKPELRDGKVVLSTSHHAAWRSFVDGGWTMLEAPVEFGGAGLPQTIHAACEELFNRASPAFGMLPTPMRCTVRLLEAHACQSVREQWLPTLVQGSCGATICISEADAGSDLARVRTRAEPEPDGTWNVTGEKTWISFGGHDLTDQIAHMVLARTPGAPAGSRGLSLFLVPQKTDDHSNAVVVRRLEAKLGLHESPTCQLGFEGSKGYLVGEVGRGLSHLFTMIIGMRLSVGSQGAGLAGAAADLAWRYAAERRQGGRADEPAPPINCHADVQRMLLAASARAEMARGLVLLSSLNADLQAGLAKGDRRDEAAALLAWLLPITKNFCAEAAFECANEAIQVLGGAGYTREWPAEQYLRDARVLSIYEGTSGMQALDLTLRRTLGDHGRPYKAFLHQARTDLANAREDVARERFTELLATLEHGFDSLSADNAPSISYPFLRLASLATTGWVALRLTNLQDGRYGRFLASMGRHWLQLALPLAQTELAYTTMGNTLLAEFAEAKGAL